MSSLRTSNCGNQLARICSKILIILTMMAVFTSITFSSAAVVRVSEDSEENQTNSDQLADQATKSGDVPWIVYLLYITPILVILIAMVFNNRCMLFPIQKRSTTANRSRCVSKRRHQRISAAYAIGVPARKNRTLSNSH